MYGILYVEIAMLVLAMVAVAIAIVALVLDDPEIMAWFSRNLSADKKRYQHVARHAPAYIRKEKEERREWYLNSLSFSAT